MTSRFPYPLEKGDKLRIFHQIRVLASQHDIVLCALSEEAVSETDFQQVKQYCSSIYLFPLSKTTIFFNFFANILKGLPFSVSYFFNKNIQNKIHKIVEHEQPQHIYCQLIRTTEFFKNTPQPKTVDYMDAFSVGMARRAESEFFLLKPLYLLEAFLLKKYETQIAPFFNHKTIISQQDKDLLGISDMKIVPNGVDLDFFGGSLSTNRDSLIVDSVSQITNNEPQMTNNKSRIKKPYNIAFVGNMGYYPNVQAAKFLVKNILPLVKKEMPNVKILIAGARPTAEVLALANESVTVKSWIPDIREAYAQAEIFVAPLFHGSGQQNKILEAMAMGVPCVTTSLVNNAISATPNTEILLADTEGVFAKQILEILQSPNFQLLIKKNARDFVEKHYSWASSTAVLNSIFEEEELQNLG
jgi:polysaccharide biosynthesis protein PslH